MKTPKKIMFVAAEASSSMHLSQIIHHLKSTLPNIELFGIGGNDMEKEGVQLYYNLKNLAVMGFVSILPKIFTIYKAFKTLLQVVETRKPDLIILADYPGFNLRFLKKVKKYNIPVIYYIPPITSVIPKKNRFEVLKKNTAYTIPLFPRDHQRLLDHQCQSVFFGHPLLQSVNSSLSKEAFFTKYAFNTNQRIISLFPGSRQQEIKYNLPILLKTAAKLHKKYKDLIFIIPVSDSIAYSIKNKIAAQRMPITLLVNDTYNAIAHSYFAINVSGTLNLELALLECVSVTIYNMALWDKFVISLILLLKIAKPPYSLANIILQTYITPEITPPQSSVKKTLRLAEFYLNTPSEFQPIKKQLALIKTLLGKPDAYRNTAVFLANFLQK